MSPLPCCVSFALLSFAIIIIRSRAGKESAEGGSSKYMHSLLRLVARDRRASSENEAKTSSSSRRNS